MRVTEGVRRIIVEWHGKGVPPEETAQSLRIPVDEVKAIILQATPRHHSRNAPNSSNPGTRRKNPAGIGDNRESQQTVEKQAVPNPSTTSGTASGK